jgi:hypothetical protein
MTNNNIDDLPVVYYEDAETIHTVRFEPNIWSDNTVVLAIPACTLVIDLPKQNRFILTGPRQRKNIRQWTRNACNRAAACKAVLIIQCATSEQAVFATNWARNLLPTYHCVRGAISYAVYLQQLEERHRNDRRARDDDD